MSEFGERPRSSFGRYQLLLEMARGGMATLYLARLTGPESFEKLIVIKRIHDHYATESSFIQMFLDEARIAAAIQHPNVATVFDMGKQDKAYFIAMEYVHGQNMKDILRAAARQEGVLHWSLVCRLVADAAAGLHSAHELKSSDGVPMNVVHRDVSPQNILVSYDGSVKVVDFGIAYAAERLTSTAAGTVKGKAAYMSPEQVESAPVDRRSDIFSLGIVLWEGITMRRLFRADTEAATLLKVRDAVVPSPRQADARLPVELERITMKALARDPKDRYVAANELEEDLNRLLVAEGHYVSRKQVETVMDLLFHDRHKIKDEQLQRALKDEHTSPPVALGMDADKYSSSTSMQMSSSIDSRVASPVSRTALVIGSLVVAALVVTLGLVLFSSRSGDGKKQDGKQEKTAAAMTASMRAEPRTEPPDAAAPQMEPERPPAPMVDLKITVLPPEAKAVVVFRGKSVVGSEFRMLVPRSDGEEIIEVKAPGYRHESIVVTLSQSVATEVTLKKEVGPSMIVVPVKRTPPMQRPMGYYLDLPD
ncbi:MAG: serine/threonine-protein kinase [Polyangia bacterium]|jgi:serine/threonine-protein kinase|nr:serine/threonine-protein kinase [Polyangia bacterium]